MKNTRKGFISPIVAAIIALAIIVGGIYIYVSKESNSSQELMPISLYVQDKEIARTSDCGITQKVTYNVPFNSNIPNVSLELLFNDELSQYGVYDSIIIVDGVAKVMLKNDIIPDGRPLSALSSCESGHLLSVLNDTLTQYDVITRVELYAEDRQIQF